MNMDNKVNSVLITEVLSDPTHRLDVLYWKKFAIDLNHASEFCLQKLEEIGDIQLDSVKDEPLQKEEYYTFKITYTGRVELTKAFSNSSEIQNMKIAEKGDLVFSRINCCRGAIGIIQDFQDKCICTNETHIFRVNTSSIDPRYLQIILRHPYYQDRILSESTGASLERVRFHENSLKVFKVPIAPTETQLFLIKKISEIKENTYKIKESIEKIKYIRNKDILFHLGIQLEFSNEKDNQYGLLIDDVKENPLLRLDFEHNRPSFEDIKKISQGKYPLIEIANTDSYTQILTAKITNGSTPDGGIYPTKGIPFIQVSNIDENSVNMYEHEFITQEFHSSLKRSQLYGGEILITMAGTIGKTAVNHLKNSNVNQAIAVLRPNKKINPLYLSGFLNSDAGKIQFAKHRHDFGTPNINLIEIGKIKVPFPPLNIQNEIAAIIDEHEKKILELKIRLCECIREESEYITQFLIGRKKYDDAHQRLK